MPKPNYFAFFLSGLISLLACKEPTSSNVNPGQVLKYYVSGTVRDLNSAERLENLIVQLDGVHVSELYATLADTTDSLGFYILPDLAPGNYNLTVLRKNNPVLEKPLLVSRKDIILPLDVPKALTTSRENYKYRPMLPPFNGFFWKYADRMAGIANVQAASSAKNEIQIFEGTFNNGFVKFGNNPIVVENISFRGLAFLSSYWTSQNRSISALNPQNGTVESTTNFNYEIKDLTASKDFLWASADGNRIIKFDKHPSRVLEEVRVRCAEIGGIAWNGTQLWISDLEENMLYCLDEDYQISASYKLFFIDNYNRSSVTKSLECLAFDYTGRLWAGNDQLLFDTVVPISGGE